jgi:beta-glucosidase
MSCDQLADATLRRSARSITDVEDTMTHRDHTQQARWLALALLSCLTIPGVTACGSENATAQSVDPVSRGDTRPGGTLTAANIRALVAQMTLAEKVSMIHGAPEGTDCNSNPAAGPIFPVVSPSFAGCAGQAGYNRGVPRLGVPPLRQTDGPAGIRLGHEATALPAPVVLAASFDRRSANDFGSVLGREGRAIDQDVLYAPMINLVTVPTAGRNFETLGEDAFLAGELVADEVRGVQGEGLIATIKHFAMNDFENARMQTSIAIDEQTLRELELPAFEKGVHAGAGAVMCAYSRVNDVYSCSNDLLLHQILRGQFDFQGWVLSDFGATHRLSDLVRGLDSAMPQGNTAGLRDDPDPGNLRDPPGVGDPGTGRTLTTAVTSGSPEIPVFNDWPAVPAFTAAQWQSALDDAVFHILTAMNDVGLLEGTLFGSRFTTGAPFVPPRPDLASIAPDDFAIAQRIAETGATLLQNQRQALPLDRDDFERTGVVVMGPTSVTAYVGGGGSAHVLPFDDVPSPFDALRAGAGRGAQIRFVPGYDLDGELVPASAVTAPPDSPFAGQQGWLRSQISTVLPASGAAPAPCTGACAADQLDPVVDDTATSLPAGTAWRWQATFTAPSAGTWQLKIFAVHQSSAQLFVDGLDTTANRRINLGAYGAGAGIGATSVPSWHGLLQTAKSHDPQGPRFQQSGFTVTFAAGETHMLDLRAYADAAAPLQIRMVWVPPDWQARSIAAAVQAARGARKVIVFAYDEGTEGADRGGNDQSVGLRLPGYQDDLIAAVAAVNPRTVVVLNTGDPVVMPWVADVATILEMWYPGQRGGPATARLLLGEVSPGGKLPVTFPADPAHIPTFSADCNPGAITANPPSDGNCPLYPGVFLPGFVAGPHSYKTIDFTANGIFQGYRWYDRFDVEPLFPFGHGLSYTQFQYSDLDVDDARSGDLDVSFVVRNVGRRAGAEVPQVYLGAPSQSPPGVDFAEKQLAGFTRVVLWPGQATRVTVRIDRRDLSYWSVAQHDWVVARGQRAILVGASSRDLRLRGKVRIAR